MSFHVIYVVTSQANVGFVAYAEHSAHCAVDGSAGLGRHNILYPFRKHALSVQVHHYCLALTHSCHIWSCKLVAFSSINRAADWTKYAVAWSNGSEFSTSTQVSRVRDSGKSSFIKAVNVPS